MFGADAATNRRTFMWALVASIITPGVLVVSLFWSIDPNSCILVLWMQYMTLSRGFLHWANVLQFIVLTLARVCGLREQLIDQAMQGWALILNVMQCIIIGGRRIARGRTRIIAACADRDSEECEGGLTDIKIGSLLIYTVWVGTVTAGPGGGVPGWLRPVYFAISLLSIAGIHWSH
jgi:hypothetical protein